MTNPAAVLPKDVSALQDMVRHRDEEIGHLREQIRSLKHHLFGPKSEVLRGPEDGLQSSLFALDEDEAGELEKEEEHEEDSLGSQAKAPRRSRGRRKLPEFLPREEIVHDLPEREKLCACGHKKTCIGRLTTEVLERIPVQLIVKAHHRLKYVCQHPECEVALTGEADTVHIAAAPARMIPQSMAGHSLLAHVVGAKFVDGLPLYRIEQQMKREGLSLPRHTMSRWMRQVADRMAPLWEHLLEEVKAHPYVQVDETPFQVLNEQGRKNQTKSYLWAMRGGPSDRPIILFRYHPTRASEVIRDWLADYQGVVQTDGYVGYDFLDDQKGIIHAGCWVHARRKFVAVTKAGGKGGKPGRAGRILKVIKSMYRIESELRDSGASAEEVVAARQKRTKPLLEALFSQLKDLRLKTPPNGLLGEAVAYALNQWPRLQVFCGHGMVKPDTNDVENAIRPFVVGRKAWLFAGSPAGAEASALLYSLVETAKANGWNPTRWLNHVFDHLPTAKSKADLEVLLPTNPPPQP